MKKAIIAGALVENTQTKRIGKVVATDPVSKFAVIQGPRGYYSEWFRNLKVTSYREVE